MALKLYIPPCINTPAHPHHPPPLEKALRIQIEGPIVSIQKLLPEMKWPTDVVRPVFPLPAGPELARLAYRTIYGREIRPEDAGDMVERDEYLGWMTEVRPLRQIDYYGITFDHLVPTEDRDPEVLQINIIEMDDDAGAYANRYLPFAVDSAEYTGKKVLAVPRCCQIRKGTQDRGRVNWSVDERDSESQESKALSLR